MNELRCDNGFSPASPRSIAHADFGRTSRSLRTFGEEPALPRAAPLLGPCACWYRLPAPGMSETCTNRVPLRLLGPAILLGPFEAMSSGPCHHILCLFAKTAGA